MDYHINIERVNDDKHFRATNEAGNVVDMDSGPNPNGAGPMQLLVMAMGGCSGIDIVDILTKGRQRIDTFTMEVDAHREKVSTYSEYTHIHAHYNLTGDLDPNKVRRAIELSVGKYCSVSKILEKTADITYSFSVNGERFE